jgi:hypothetical protein
MMYVDSEQTQPEFSLVSFDVSSIPSGATISAATLTLCTVSLSAQGAGRVHELHAVTSGWGENSVTWNTQPSISSALTDSVVVPSSPACLTFDVSSDVQAWVDGSATNLGWELNVATESGNHWVEYGTRESGTAADRPRLDVTYSP